MVENGNSGERFGKRKQSAAMWGVDGLDSQVSIRHQSNDGPKMQSLIKWGVVFTNQPNSSIPFIYRYI